MKTIKEYDFEITVILDSITVEADNEEEARGKLPELVAEYFSNTQVSISHEEAKLCEVVTTKYNDDGTKDITID